MIAILQIALDTADIQVAAGEDHLEMTIIDGLVVPVPPNQLAQIPGAVVRAGLSRELALKTGKALTELGEQLPEESKIVTASSITQAEKAAEFTSSLRDGPQR